MARLRSCGGGQGPAFGQHDGFFCQVLALGMVGLINLNCNSEYRAKAPASNAEDGDERRVVVPSDGSRLQTHGRKRPQGPIVMVNLLKYREKAAYEAGPRGRRRKISRGREAYQRYGMVAMQHVIEARRRASCGAGRRNS